jgi:hypothetical protein
MFCFLNERNGIGIEKDSAPYRTIVGSERGAGGERVSVLAALLQYPDETSIKKTIRRNSSKQMTAEYLVISRS